MSKTLLPYRRDERAGAGSSHSSQIEGLIAALGSDDGQARREARERLVKMGRPAVSELIKTLLHSSDEMRWEAAEALLEIREPTSAQALVRSLEDANAGVRWIAAEALVSLGYPALDPMLRALERRSSSVWLRRGAHHVLRELAERGLREEASPVLNALEDVAPAAQVPPAAWRTLEAMGQRGKRRAG